MFEAIEQKIERYSIDYDTQQFKIISDLLHYISKKLDWYLDYENELRKIEGKNFIQTNKNNLKVVDYEEKNYIIIFYDFKINSEYFHYDIIIWCIDKDNNRIDFNNDTKLIVKSHIENYEYKKRPV